MEIKDMVDLLHIYDAAEDLEKIANTLSGSEGYGYGFSDGIVGELKRVVNLIDHFSPIYDPYEDFDSQLMGRVLNDRNRSYEERAKIILGITDENGAEIPKISARTKYDPIGEYLYRTGEEEVTLTFDQMKGILGFDLPKSAKTYNAWWSNTGQRHAIAWTAYGYMTERVTLDLCKIRFRKEGTCPDKEIIEEIERKKDSLMPIDTNADVVTVCGYDFTYVQDIEPLKDKNGKVMEYEPQADYKNTGGKQLHRYGSGSFCRFSVNAGNWPGVYLWVVENEIIYIGETAKLGNRFNTGYGNISGINCFQGGQTTNCKMNKVVLELSRIGKTVKLYFFNTTDYKKVELELLDAINTQYNEKDNR